MVLNHRQCIHSVFLKSAVSRQLQSNPSLKISGNFYFVIVENYLLFGLLPYGNSDIRH